MKLLLKLVVVLILLVMIAIAAGLYYVDSIAKTAIERGGTYALGVETTVANADVHVLAGTFSLDGLKVANPGGFKSSEFMVLGNGRVELELGSLRDDTVRLPALRLSNVDMTLERKGNQANYNVILGNLKRFESAEKPDPAPGTGGKKFIIGEIVISDVNVSAEVFPLGGSLTRLDVPIEEIRLQNVGSDSDTGVLMSELTAVIVKAIFAAVTRAGVDILPTELLGDLTNQLTALTDLPVESLKVLSEQTGELASEMSRQIENVTKGVVPPVDDLTRGTGEVVEGLGKGVDEAVKGIGEAAEGLGKLFGGSKKKKTDDP